MRWARYYCICTTNMVSSDSSGDIWGGGIPVIEWLSVLVYKTWGWLYVEEEMCNLQWLYVYTYVCLGSRNTYFWRMLSGHGGWCWPHWYVGEAISETPAFFIPVNRTVCSAKTLLSCFPSLFFCRSCACESGQSLSSQCFSSAFIF